ncbi:SnoaL-like domain-containing protein [Massilia sp. RP-1-19]|uniref:SnoaL-like domain-containing protein n=1 Tax=Massilia polaris TaxID=2728846 RepID=A0A848HS20_9BURK|nr:ester cyclase [Massilia polaris]NML62083.1 SnoaL-like domain-containing protein [Massilia polaris]
MNAVLSAKPARQVQYRTRGQRQAWFNRLVSPSGLGERIKPFVFLDDFDIAPSGKPLSGLHPHSGIATLTVIVSGEMEYIDTTGKTGILPTGGVEWMNAGGGVWHGAIGNYALFDELFADDFVDHTPQPNSTPDKAGALKLYKTLRSAFPDFRANIHWQIADGDRVTTYKTYHGTHRGEFLGVAPTGRSVQFETVNVMRVQDGKIAEHWGVANLYSLIQQLTAT